MLTVPFTLIGGFWFIWFLGLAISVATAVGFIALATLATEFGVVMMIYLFVMLSTTGYRRGIA